MAAFAMLDAARESEPTAMLKFIPGTLFTAPGIGVATNTGTYVATTDSPEGIIVYAQPAPALASESA